VPSKGEEKEGGKNRSQLGLRVKALLALTEKGSEGRPCWGERTPYKKKGGHRDIGATTVKGICKALRASTTMRDAT